MADMFLPVGTPVLNQDGTMNDAWWRYFQGLENITTGTALTRINDTNVTLTLGGDPNAALVNAASITVGWAGTLGLSRGGTAADLSATGGANQVLQQSTLGGAITVGTLAGSAISGAALTKTDDTNVTLALGGTPATALLKATSLTLGWTGQLGLARGGTHADLSATGGTGRVLKQTSVGADVTVATVAASEISSGAALTKTDDTNVTLTLGGAPTTALLSASSLTLGWTGTLAVARGGIGVGTLAAHGVLIGNGTSAVSVTGTGTSGQALISNGSSADPTFQTFTSGAITLLHYGSGSTTSAGASNVDTIALSGLTAKDTLYVTFQTDAVSQPSGVFVLQSSTDSTNVTSIIGNLTAGQWSMGTATIRPDVAGGTTVYDATVNYIAGASGGSTATNVFTSTTLATAFTSSWTLALRNGGVTAGGTAHWQWSVYKMAGQ